ncbi:MAG TPA: hypothetical protein VJ208_02430 [Candidatus Nanoarchaeia archaeon]|nr:hypothetical protein [Candidatus Nanoarchaeia archaeon]
MKEFDKDVRLEFVGKNLVRTVRNSALNVIDIPRNYFRNFGFENLPEYETVKKAIEIYAEAVGRLYNKRINEPDEK